MNDPMLPGIESRYVPDTVKASDCWATSPTLYEAIVARYGPCDLDVCAQERNAKCARWIGPPLDALAERWEADQAWCNPPYSDIGPWLAKARAEIDAGHLTSALFLVPAATTDGWWHKHVPRAERITFLSPRVAFVGPEGPVGRPNFHVALLQFSRFSRGSPPDVAFLRWR